VPGWWSDASQGGGWLGAHASHVVDQIRVTLGEFGGVSASLPMVSDRDWTAEDTYVVHFRTHGGVDGIMCGSAGTWGPPLAAIRVAGSAGTLWVEGDQVHVADAAGTRTLEVPQDLVNEAPSPPDPDLLVTAYDMMHSMGIDLSPYTRLFEILRARMQGREVAPDPAPATFADGVAGMQVLDAIRRSAREQCWVPIESR
jgi:predicted dehydrogenase